MGLHVEAFGKLCKERFELQKQLPQVFYKKGVLKNVAKFTGKQPSQSLFFTKVAGLRPATLFKKRLWHRCFPVNFAKFVRTSFFQKTWRLLLELHVLRWRAGDKGFNVRLILLLPIKMLLNILLS